VQWTKLSHGHCSHKTTAVNQQSAADKCVFAAGESNPEHFFIATQDRELRAAIDSVPGGASIFASVNGLHLQARLQWSPPTWIHEGRPQKCACGQSPALARIDDLRPYRGLLQPQAAVVELNLPCPYCHFALLYLL